MSTTSTYEASLLERVIVPADPDLPAEAAEWFLSLGFQKVDLRRMKKLAAKARAGTLSAMEMEELRDIERIARENLETLRNEWDTFCSGSTRTA